MLSGLDVNILSICREFGSYQSGLRRSRTPYKQRMESKEYAGHIHLGIGDRFSSLLSVSCERHQN